MMNSDRGDSGKYLDGVGTPGRSGEKIVLCSPVSGKVIPLGSVPDPAFAENMMGKGAAILPERGEVFAPADGVVETVADTRHAVGFRADTGVELLIHVGIETVKLKGRFFRVFVSEGDRVRKGDVLIRFDVDGIISAGHSPAIPVTVINSDEYESVAATESASVESGEPLLYVTKGRK